MISIRTIFEDKGVEYLKNNFMNDFKSELEKENIKVDHFGMQMIVKKEYMKCLLDVTQKYLVNIVGIKINNLKVMGYTNVDELPPIHSFHVKMNSYGGMDTKGFYNRLDETIYIRIGEHLKSLLPTLFHELTHVYIHQNDIIIKDDFPNPTTVCFDFASMMCDADQAEGICELVSSLMCYHIFDVNQYPSNVDEYWLGWRLSVQGYIAFAEILANKYPQNDNIWVTKMAFISLMNHLKKTNNLYKFVDRVPKDEYHRTKCIHGSLGW